MVIRSLIVTIVEDVIHRSPEPEVELRQVEANGIAINVAVSGAGPPVLLLHGWPHTWRLWTYVIPGLAARHRVIAPDLRGLGDSTKAIDGYDANGLADDTAALLDALGEPEATIVGIDAGAAPAFMLAMRQPHRVRRLVLMESLIGVLPGAEDFLKAGPPWWFGFHAVPQLAETVLVGHEAEYVDFFLKIGTAQGRGVDPGVRDAFVSAYTGEEALRCGFAYYRAMPTNAQQIRQAVDAGRLTVPTMAVAGGSVGDALHQQLSPITDDLVARRIDNCGHLIPLEQPGALVDVMTPFLDG